MESRGNDSEGVDGDDHWEVQLKFQEDRKNGESRTAKRVNLLMDEMSGPLLHAFAVSRRKRMETMNTGLSMV